MSRIYKRPKSKYYQYTTGTPPNRIRVSTGQTNHHAAKIKQKELDEKYERQGLVASPNLAKFIESYLIWHKDNKKSDWSDRVGYGLQTFKDMYASMDISNLDIEHITSFKKHRMKSAQQILFLFLVLIPLKI